MKNIFLIAIAFFLYSCGTIAPNTMLYKNQTPEAYHVSQNEKENVNYDLRENKKLVAKNLEHKKQNTKAAAERAEEVQKELNELNSKVSKNKKNKSYYVESFSFYH